MKEITTVYICLGAVLFLLLVILIGLFSKRSFPYESRPILTKREYKFYMLLRKEADRRNLLICPKVGVKDLLGVTDSKHYMKYFRRIAQKHIDFVICDRGLRVIFALELDDSSHDTREARKRDDFKDRAFKAAGIPLKRIRDFDEEGVKELFHKI